MASTQAEHKLEDGGLLEDLPPMSQFLNRLLSLKLGMQKTVFNAFEQRLDDAIQVATTAGTLDSGVENYKAEGISKAQEDVVHSDPQTGAQTKHVVMRVKRKTQLLPFDRAQHGYAGQPPLAWVRNKRSGQVWAVQHWREETSGKTGSIEVKVRLRGPTGEQFINKYDVLHGDNFERLDEQAVKPLWEEQVARPGIQGKRRALHYGLDHGRVGPATEGAASHLPHAPRQWADGPRAHHPAEAG